MKHRKVELCSIKGCKHYMQPQTDLTRHLKNCHNGMTKKQYYAKRYLLCYINFGIFILLSAAGNFKAIKIIQFE